jgi:hypothetical protein
VGRHESRRRGRGSTSRLTATGLWTEGNTTNGPDGVGKPWPDNFFNFADLGVCMYCAQTATAHWGALIGYIGSSPPAAGSYTSTAVFREATKVFYVGKNYEASAPASGRLWLNKNTDAYSNYTVDNRGQVEAAIAVSPPELAIRYHERAKVAAASVNALEPLQQATNFCVRAVSDHLRNQVLKEWFKSSLNQDLQILVDPSLVLVTGYQDTLKISYEASNGQLANATWDAGRFIYRVMGLFPGDEFKLFGLVGLPALDCTMAGLWYTGELGGQIGRLLREKLQPPSTLDASIMGAWTLERSAPIPASTSRSVAPAVQSIFDSTPARPRNAPSRGLTGTGNILIQSLVAAAPGQPTSKTSE